MLTLTLLSTTLHISVNALVVRVRWQRECACLPSPLCHVSASVACIACEECNMLMINSVCSHVLIFSNLKYGTVRGIGELSMNLSHEFICIACNYFKTTAIAVAAALHDGLSMCVCFHLSRAFTSQCVRCRVLVPSILNCCAILVASVSHDAVASTNEIAPVKRVTVRRGRESCISVLSAKK
jgi:hypothetical protein